jgi:hypothetical protein
MADKIKKAHGHIMQADWNQTDPLQMDYIHNKPKIPTLDHLASLEDLDKQQIKVVNRSGKVYTSQIKIEDLTWESDPRVGYTLSTANVPLPAELVTNDTIYTIKLINIPTDTSALNTGWGGGIGIIHPDATDISDTNMWDQAVLKGLLYCDNTGGYANDNIINRTVTWTGPWQVIEGESSGEHSFLSLWTESNTLIEYSFIKEESDEEALGPVHNIDLHSNTEVHYDFPVTELTINTLHKCFSDNINQQWVVSFIAGDIDPIVIVPESVNNKPVKWINGKPQFRSNKKYMLTFKEITDTFYIETKLLSEDKICDQWILCPYDNQSEGATYGDLLLTSVFLHDIVLNLKENEIFEILGGKTTFVITPYTHPDYEASQGTITISGVPEAYISNCINLKIWKIRKPTSMTELEVHILGSYIPASGDNLPGTAACTDSTFYLILSDYISKCVTGGGTNGHGLVKYSNIL